MGRFFLDEMARSLNLDEFRDGLDNSAIQTVKKLKGGFFTPPRQPFIKDDLFSIFT